MKRKVRQAEILILAGTVLFAALVALLAVDTDISGKATSGTRVNITNSSPANCTTTTLAGRNSVSFPCVLNGQPRPDVISDTGLWAMYQYVPGESDTWRVHNPNLPSYVISDLTHMSRRVGYVFIMNTSRTYTITGFDVESTNVPMVAGWNLVGYPSNVTRNASDSFADIDNFTEARTYDNLGSQYLIYLNPGGGTLNLTIPGEGYWINATNSLTWSVTS